MALKVGELFALITADDKQFSQTMRHAKEEFKLTGSALKSVGSGMTKWVTAPIVAFGAAGVAASANFEQSMSNVKAVAGATAKEMEMLTALAIKMGKETKYSAVESAAGMEELLKAGVSVEDVLNGGLEGALTLAAAGNIGLAESAEVASTVLNAFKKDNLEVAQAADILAGAANASATDVAELKYGLSMSSAVASAMGMTFKDTATALAVFAQSGLKGSDAGTSLKTMLMNLQPQTDKQVALFERLNLLSEEGSSLFYDEKGNMKGLADISGLLRDRMKGMTNAQRAMAMEIMFGSDAVRAANILFENGSEGVSKMWDAMDDVSAAEVAKVKMDNLKGSIEQLGGSIETAQIKLFNSSNGPIRSVVDTMRSLVDKFIDLPDAQAQSVLGFGIVAAAIGPVLWLMGGLVGSVATLIEKGPVLLRVFKGVGAGATVAGTNVGGLTSMIGWLVGTTGGIVTLGLAFAALYGWIAKTEAKWGKARAMADEQIGIKEGKDYASTSSARDRMNGDESSSTSRSDAIMDAREKQRLKNSKIPALAAGGVSIVGRPTLAMIGEGTESEAVAPLSKLASMIQAAVNNAQQRQPALVSHTGTIRVEGVNNRQQLVAVADMVFDKIRKDGRR